MSRLTAAVLAGAVVVSGLSVAAAGRDVPAPVEVARPPEQVPISRTALVCPEAPTTAKSDSTLFALVPPVADDGGSTDEGTATLTTLDGEESADLGTLAGPGQASLTELGPDQAPAVQLTADGSFAPGITAAQWTKEQSDSLSGLAISACGAAADDFWFPGVTTAVGSTSRLIVSNPTPAIAVVDLEFFGKGGKVKAVGERGIAVGPLTRQSLDLSTFAPGLDPATLHVSASSGRVAVALRTDRINGFTPAGSEWIAPSAAPGTDLVIDAGLADASGQQLELTNPGDRQALVKVQVIDTGGPFTPSGFENISIPPGSVRVKPLDAVTDGSALAISIRSSGSVLGAVVSEDDDAADFTMSSVGSPITDPAVVPVVPGTDLSLVFASGTRTSGQVSIEAFGRGGESIRTDEVNLKGFASTTWEPGKTGDRKPAYYVVTVTVDAGLQAVAHYDSDDGVATLPVSSGVYAVQRPGVQSAH